MKIITDTMLRAPENWWVGGESGCLRCRSQFMFEAGDPIKIHRTNVSEFALMDCPLCKGDRSIAIEFFKEKSGASK